MAKSARKHQHDDTCATPGCDGEVYCCGLCRPCYQYDHRWTRYKNAAERRQHMQNLELRQARMEQISLHTKLRRVK